VALVLLVPVIALFQRRPGAWVRRNERILVVFAAVLVLWACWRWSLTLNGGDGVPRAPVHERLETVARLGRYLVWTLRGTALPTVPVPIHDTASAPGVEALVGLGMVLALVAVSVRRARGVALGLLWIVLASLPTSPLARPGFEQADRYLLLPSFGAALAWVCLAKQVLAPVWQSRVAVVAVTAQLVVGVAGSLAYRDELTLFRTATARAPDAAAAWAGLAYVLRHRGELDEAREAADAACRLAPQSVPVRLTRAYVFLEVGDEPRARAELEWVRARGGDEVPGLRRALECLEGPASVRRECLHRQRSAR
jgi:hypothetical protein